MDDAHTPLRPRATRRRPRARRKRECAADLKALGLEVQAGRIERWFELYGQKLGITSVAQPDKVAQALEAWHGAWGTLVVQVRAAFDDPSNEDHQIARERLLAPYEEQAEAERREEQKPRKGKKAEPSESEGLASVAPWQSGSRFEQGQGRWGTARRKTLGGWVTARGSPGAVG